MVNDFIDEISNQEAILKAKDLSVFYGSLQAVNNVTFNIPRNKIVALIGPSGCGKSTLIRCFNRMNDLIPTAKVEGEIVKVPPALVPYICAIHLERLPENQTAVLPLTLA